MLDATSRFPQYLIHAIFEGAVCVAHTDPGILVCDKSCLKIWAYLRSKLCSKWDPKALKRTSDTSCWQYTGEDSRRRPLCGKISQIVIGIGSFQDGRPSQRGGNKI